MIDAEFWVAIAFIIFVGFLFYMGLHRAILDALDRRGARIKAELDEALRLKQEAEKLLAEYQRRHGEAEHEAAAIIASAKVEAERTAAEAKAKMEDLVARRTKVAQAEAQALAEVRAAAADAAVAAAQAILTKTATGKVADDLVARGIQDV